MKDLANVDIDLLEEAALAALEHGKFSADQRPLEQSVDRFQALLGRAGSGSQLRTRAVLEWRRV